MYTLTSTDFTLLSDYLVIYFPLLTLFSTYFSHLNTNKFYKFLFIKSYFFKKTPIMIDFLLYFITFFCNSQ
ncbi:hypothetical protein EUBDOL_00585 [Amedibacillus dolichus DSM 3991]|uniref:Uncharacterized protein n=1 Tax=Amedibacillus dolichus DSM 3991 TaxID=428127 RepID=A8R9Q2_9FIRM|nr:hypothetical protein EUBDOL_00585 [Amedibacillus dolichus DSM 3991]